MIYSVNRNILLENEQRRPLPLVFKVHCQQFIYNTIIRGAYVLKNCQQGGYHDVGCGCGKCPTWQEN